MSAADLPRAVEVRLVKRDELAQARGLLVPEGWDFSVDELARLERLGGCVGAWEDGRLVGFLTYTDVPPLRWVGNVVVHESMRGLGVGARIVQKALEGAPRVGLYAVEKAVTLYQRLGFVPHGDAYAYRAEAARPVRPGPAERMTKADLLEVARFDRAETTLDRGYLLRELLSAYPESALVVRQRGLVVGYGFAKTSPGLTEIGPVVASAPRVAEDLLDGLLAATPGPHEATVLAANRRGVGALEERGFARRFRTVLMYRGEPATWREGALAAAAGLEKG